MLTEDKLPKMWAMPDEDPETQVNDDENDENSDRDGETITTSSLS